MTIDQKARWFDLTGDARLGACATDDCGGQPTKRLEAEGVGSNYCSGCAAKIAALPASDHAGLVERLKGVLKDYDDDLARTIAAGVLPDRFAYGEDVSGVTYADIREAATVIQTLQRERDEAFAANERDRSIVAEVRASFNAALARRSWLLHGGRGSYEWDDDRWKAEFGQAVDELGAALEPLGKLGIDWSLCPTTPEEIAAARIDWKARAEAAEQQVRDMREGLEPFARVGDIFELRAGNRPNSDDDPVTEWEDHRVGARRLTVGDFRRARLLLKDGGE